MTISQVLVATLLVAVLYQTVKADPCQIAPTSVNLNERVIAPIQTLTACFDSIPVDQDRISSTLSVLRQLANLYSFTDILKADLAPWYMNIDLLGRLDDISKKSYNSDYEFHTDVNRLFNSLNDAHTMYYPPIPYTSCFGFKPFSLQPKIENETVVIRVTANELVSTLGFSGYITWGIDASNYYGAQVLAINNEPTDAYLKTYSSLVGTYKDPQVRFNALFGENGWNLINTYTLQFKDVPTEVLTLQTSAGVVNLTLPVVSVCQPIFNGLDAITKLMNTPLKPSAKRYTDEQTPSVTQPDIHLELQDRINEISVTPVDETSDDFNSAALSVEEREQRIHEQLKQMGDVCNAQYFDSATDKSISFTSYCDNNNNMIPVLKVKTFAPKKFDEFVNVLSVYKNVIAAYKWDYVVVDVAGNGGGVLCFSMLLQGLMSEELAHTSLDGEILWRPMSLRKSDLMTKFYMGGDVDGMDEDYMNPQSGQIESPKDFYTKSNTVHFNSIQSEVTDFVYFPASCKQFVLDSNFPRVKFWPKHVIILTDGTCGSACAQFVSKMTQHDRALLVATGGYMDANAPAMRTGSFPGGNVVEIPGSAVQVLPDLTVFKTSAMSFDNTRAQYHEQFYETKCVPKCQGVTYTRTNGHWVTEARYNMHQAFNNLNSQLPLEFDFDAFTPNFTIKNWNNYDYVRLLLNASALWPNFTQPYISLPPIANSDPFNITMPVPPFTILGFPVNWKFWLVTGSIVAAVIIIPVVIVVIKKRRRRDPVYTPLINSVAADRSNV